MPILYNPICRANEHAPFDAALAVSAHLAFPEEPLVFISEHEHLVATQTLVPDQVSAEATWIPVEIPKRLGTGSRERFVSEWDLLSRAIQEAKCSASSHIIACAISAAGLLAVEMRSSLRRSGTITGIIHHSGLSGILGSRRTAILLKRSSTRNVRQMVLGDGIRRNVLAHRNGPREILSIHHPYLFPTAAPAEWPDFGPVRFGFPGLASREKGFQHFCRLATVIASSGVPAEFELVGSFGHEFHANPPPGIGFVHVLAAGEHLATNQYARRLSAQTYLVLPFDPEVYDVVASGSVLDAFAHAKPVIALRNSQFEQYFAEMGDIGYLCGSIDEMHRLITKLLCERDLERYRAQSLRIVLGRRQYSPESVSAELVSVLN